MFKKITDLICEKSYRQPGLWMIIALILCIPAIYQIQQVKLNTNPLRLLPKNSRSAVLTRELESMVEEKGFFYVLLQSPDKEKLIEALNSAGQQIVKIPEAKSITFRYPVDFFEKYRFLLIPSEYLNKILETLIRWEAEVSPLGLDLLGEEQEETQREIENKKYLDQIMELYGNLPLYHQSKDGQIMGITIVPEKGLKDMAETRKLFSKLKKITQDTSFKYNIWADLGGSLSRWVNGYNTVISDIKRSGMILFAGILLILIIGFRSFRVLPVLLFPLILGLLWALGSIPTLVGDLNTITSFFLVVSFGLGIDFSIHLLKRFQKELNHQPMQKALKITMSQTGKSVLTSGITTALALFILAWSDFRGISEFGVVGGNALIMILLAILIFMPATIILGFKIRLIKPSLPKNKKNKRFPPSLFFIVFLALTLVAFMLGSLTIKFDYNFGNLGGKINESPEIKNKQDQVYPTALPPAVVYVADNLKTLDKLLQLLNRHKTSDPDTNIGWVRSVRDFCPGEQEALLRFKIINEIKEQVQGRWLRRLEDPDRKRLIEDLQHWQLPEKQPDLTELPDVIKRNFIASDDSGKFLAAIYTAEDRTHGKNAIAFTKELIKLAVPDQVRGPVGETAVLAEILLLVISEGPWLVLIAFVGVLLLIFIAQRSFIQTIWLVLPLISGLALTIGIMGVFGIKINFYNIVVFPALLGMGVDDGVHFIRRWKEKNQYTEETWSELFGVLTITTITTMLGYAGLTLAHHPGLNSIGVLACIGLSSIWVASLFLLPGLLHLFYKPKINPLAK